MLEHFFVLGLRPDASGSAIRNRYLELVKQYSPEQSPQEFRRITAAYEAIKEKRDRIAHQILNLEKRPEESLRQLARAKPVQRRRVGLKTLLQAQKEE